MKTKADVLSVKEEKFCQLIAAGNCKDQSDAYRKVFKVRPKTKDSSVHVAASKLMANPKIAQRIQALMLPVIAAVRVTRAEWLKKMESFFYSDVRKMFDEFGNPIEIPQLGDHEAAMIEGFEFCEDYTKVKKADGSTDAVPTGYTKKYKLTPKIKAMLEFGKVMGWCDGESAPGENKPTVNITVNFIKGDTKAAPKVVNPQPAHMGPQVAFVRR